MEQKLRLGVIEPLTNEPANELQRVNELNLPTCQICCWDPSFYNEDNVRKLQEASKQYSVEVTTIWAGYPGPMHWNFTEGPASIGLVPPEYRAMRVDALKRGADFAAACGIPSITTHVGFIPENPADPLYVGTVIALIDVVQYCKRLGLFFCFETGQETPVTLLRAINDIGTDNLGINLDPANLILYGKANPVDALDVFGKYVKGVHAKDGVYPTEPRNLGHETALGEGKVNFPVLVPKLKSFGYNGTLTIEREISGPQQIADIKMAMQILEPYL